MPSDEDLAHFLRDIDGRPYPAYKSLSRRYEFPRFALGIDRVQGDPFASPSRLGVEISHTDSGLPEDLFSNVSRRTGTETYLALAFSKACSEAKQNLGSGKSGLLAIDTPGQEILARTCVEIGEASTIVRFAAGLPANGRRINGRAADALLLKQVPRAVERALVFGNLNADHVRSYADCNEDADFLRVQIAERGLVAFVAEGAILPRASGVSDRPMADAVPFCPPESLRTTIALPHAGEIDGMGIPEGVTLIVGGGYHGKSTLLNALDRGIYNHRPKDGRELVVTRGDAVKIRAEDGRSVAGVNLSPFINNLPGGKDTLAFTTENASGSTSQAAGIIEAIEAGARCLLIDEDISATNFLIRDDRMQQLIAAEKEPITPFVRRVRSLYERHGVSTVLVLGGSGDYFGPADRVIAMDSYRPVDVTQRAKELAGDYDGDDGSLAMPTAGRIADPESIDPWKRGGREPRMRVRARGRSLEFGEDAIDLSLVPQIVDEGQVRAVGAALAYARERDYFAGVSMMDALRRVYADVEREGFSAIGVNDLVAVRPCDVAAALNRLRSLRVE